MRTHLGLPLAIGFGALAIFAAACGGSAQQPAEEPTPQITASPETPPSADTAAAAAGASAAPSAEPATTAPAVKASTHTIDGVSISDLTSAQLAEALKKRGWEGAATPDVYAGKYEQIGVSGKNSKKEIITVSITRVAKSPGTPTAGVTEADYELKTLEGRYAKMPTTAQKHDAEAQVLVAVMLGKSKADPAKVLEALLAPAKPTEAAK